MTELAVLDVRIEQAPNWRAHLDLPGLASYIGFECAGEARERAAVDTGAMKGSIRYDVDTDSTATNATVEYSANTYYAIYVELGTRLMIAQPFLLPALRPGVEAALRKWKAGQRKAMASGATITAKEAATSRVGAVALQQKRQAAEAAQSSTGSP